MKPGGSDIVFHWQRAMERVTWLVWPRTKVLVGKHGNVCKNQTLALDQSEAQIFARKSTVLYTCIARTFDLNFQKVFKMSGETLLCLPTYLSAAATNKPSHIPSYLVSSHLISPLTCCLAHHGYMSHPTTDQATHLTFSLSRGPLQDRRGVSALTRIMQHPAPTAPYSRQTGNCVDTNSRNSFDLRFWEPWPNSRPDKCCVCRRRSRRYIRGIDPWV